MNTFAKQYEVFLYLNGNIVAHDTIDVWFDIDISVKELATRLKIEYDKFTSHYVGTES